MSKERARTGDELQPCRFERKRGGGTLRGWYLKEYDAVRAGTIDGMGRFVNDRAVLKADNIKYFPTKNTEKVTGNPLTTLFVGRLSPETTEETLKDAFKEYGEINKVVVARNLVTGHSRCYSFIEFTLESSCASAYKSSRTLMIDGQMVTVDYERSRVMVNWKPRRLGGGISGYKESGQLRFGARNRPFKFPNESFYKNSKCPIVPSEQLREECWRDHVVPPKNQNEPHPRRYPESVDSRSDFQREHDTDRYRRHRNQDERPYSHKTDSHMADRGITDRRYPYATDKGISDRKRESIITGSSNPQHHRVLEYERSSQRSQRNSERIERAYNSIDDNKTHSSSNLKYHNSEDYHQRELENKDSSPPPKRSRYSDHQTSYSKSSSSRHHHSSHHSRDPEPDRRHRSRHNNSSSKRESIDLQSNSQKFSSSRNREGREDRYHSRSKH